MKIKILRTLVVLPGILFLVMGIRWLVAPEGVASELGMPLLDGIGLSSQIGDMAAFFLTLGVCILAGVATSKRYWFYPATLLLGFAACSRILAWLVHDAALATGMIGFEIVVALLLWFGSAGICKKAN